MGGGPVAGKGAGAGVGWSCAGVGVVARASGRGAGASGNFFVLPGAFCACEDDVAFCPCDAEGALSASEEDAAFGTGFAGCCWEPWPSARLLTSTAKPAIRRNMRLAAVFILLRFDAGPSVRFFRRATAFARGVS